MSGPLMLVKGMVPPDENLKKMKAVWDACAAAGIPIPTKVSEFFNWEKPDGEGMLMDLTDKCNKWSKDGDNVIEISMKDVPSNVKAIRFINSY